jgi:uncharacterized protein YigE (DUF2233 family)
VEEQIEHAEARFRVVRANPEQVQTVWISPNGTPYRTFDQVQAAFSKQGKTVTFLVNAGIFEPGGIPSGLHVENRKTLHLLNLADAPGNFFLKPNGVIWIESAGTKCEAFISPSEEFQKQHNSHRLLYAVQSGPLLLDKGHRHPAFNRNSPSKLHRNGVGVDAAGRIVFSITDRGQSVNLWDFAGLFLKLGCRDALFLDGDISQSVANPDKPVQSNRFGAMFVIAEKVD